MLKEKFQNVKCDYKQLAVGSKKWHIHLSIAETLDATAKGSGMELFFLFLILCFLEIESC